MTPFVHCLSAVRLLHGDENDLVVRGSPLSASGPPLSASQAATKRKWGRTVEIEWGRSVSSSLAATKLV